MTKPKNMTPEEEKARKEKRRLAQKAYEQSPKGKARRKAYAKAYNQSANGKARRKAYNESTKSKVRNNVNTENLIDSYIAVKLGIPVSLARSVPGLIEAKREHIQIIRSIKPKRKKDNAQESK